jgi:hypothetical protein
MLKGIALTANSDGARPQRTQLDGTTNPGGQKPEGRNPKSERNPNAEIGVAAGDGELMLVSGAKSVSEN